MPHLGGKVHQHTILETLGNRIVFQAQQHPAAGGMSAQPPSAAEIQHEYATSNLRLNSSTFRCRPQHAVNSGAIQDNCPCSSCSSLFASSSSAFVAASACHQTIIVGRRKLTFQVPLAGSFADPATCPFMNACQDNTDLQRRQKQSKEQTPSHTCESCACRTPS